MRTRSTRTAAGWSKPGLYWSQPGASLNGPVKIPGLYDGKDKTFFMYNWEQIRSRSAVPAGLYGAHRARAPGRLLADAHRRRPSMTIYDPTTTRSGQRAPSCAIRSRATASRRTASTRLRWRILQRVPLPNAAALVNNLLVPGQRARRQIRPARVEGRSGDGRRTSASSPASRATNARRSTTMRRSRRKRRPGISTAAPTSGSPASTPRCCRRRWS